MPLPPDLRALAKLSPDPTIVLDGEAHVVFANAAARAGGADDLARDASLLDLLRAASGTSEAAIGALALADGRRVKAFAIVLAREPRLYALRLERPENDRFRQLTERIRDLDAEVSNRRSVQARLEETLSQRDVLYSELQHRVKNNLQLMLALFSAARREASAPAQAAFLDALQAKLEAVSSTQHLMYASRSMAGVPARQLAEHACRAHQPVGAESRRCIVEGDDSVIKNDHAFPLALILNELVANALKYGSTQPGSVVLVILRREGAGHELIVEDEGPGFEPRQTERAHTGLGLVRGLCRQIGGALFFERGAGGRGARVVVRF